MGRKKLGRSPHTIKLHDRDWEKAQAIGGGNASAAIEALLQAEPNPPRPEIAATVESIRHPSSES